MLHRLVSLVLFPGMGEDPRKSKLIRSPLLWRASWLRRSFGALNPFIRFVSQPGLAPGARNAPSEHLASPQRCSEACVQARGQRRHGARAAQGRPRSADGLARSPLSSPRIGHLVTARRSPCFLCLPSSWSRNSARGAVFADVSDLHACECLPEPFL